MAIRDIDYTNIVAQRNFNCVIETHEVIVCFKSGGVLSFPPGFAFEEKRKLTLRMVAVLKQLSQVPLDTFGTAKSIKLNYTQHQKN